MSILKDLKTFCLIDVGSTTTKAILFSKNNEWRFLRAEEATTVEKPFEDVTFGVAQALQALERESGEKLLENGRPIIPCFSTSSAGGGLAVVVSGLIREVTSKSAERAALGAGSIIQDVIALDDGRTPYKKIEILKTLRPDMVLLAGGFDGGSVSGPVFMTELICQSNLRPKLSLEGKLPVIYAGNAGAQQYIDEMLKARYIYVPVPNLRPSNTQENLEPTRNAIHDVFMEHVMSRAPGYEKYTSWISAPILPTPAAVAKLLALVSKEMRTKILAIDIGGATTDIFTADNGEVFRTVSANLGMSYSILNVVKQVGLENIRDLVDFSIDERELLDRIGNKFLRPTELPASIDDTKIECAIASAAIREAVKEHFRVMYGVSMSLSGEELTWHFLKRKKPCKTMLGERPSFQGYDMIIGSGGKLSHSPRRTAAAILLNALDPIGSIRLAVDSVFMFPQLGTLAQANPELALELFHKFGLVKLGTLSAPSGNAKPGSEVIKVSGTTKANLQISETVKYGEVTFVEPNQDEPVTLDMKVKKLKSEKGQITLIPEDGPLIIDARGRPSANSCPSFIPDEYKPVTRKFEISEEQKIYSGEIKIHRELAIPGEVLVGEGDMVSEETIIAKSVRAFLRPFFLNIAERIDIPPRDLPSYFQKKIGDEVEKNEILAKHKVDLVRTKTFRSPVSGIVEKILPSGAVIVREKPENVRKLYHVQIANELYIKSNRIKAYLTCEVGDEVENSQTLAILGKPPYQRKSISPIRGVVKGIDLEDGIVIIEPLLEELELIAWMPGKVEKTTERGCVLANRGTVIQGVWGNDKQVYGELARDNIGPGKIVARDSVNSDDLERMRDANITGLIAGGLHLKDYHDLKLSFAIMITEGFGKTEFDPGIKKILSANHGMLVSLDTHTQLRAGVQRPRIIIPETE